MYWSSAISTGPDQVKMYGSVPLVTIINIEPLESPWQFTPLTSAFIERAPVSEIRIVSETLHPWSSVISTEYVPEERFSMVVIKPSVRRTPSSNHEMSSIGLSESMLTDILPVLTEHSESILELFGVINVPEFTMKVSVATHPFKSETFNV